VPAMFRGMITPRERRHFEAIGRAEAEQARHSIEAAAGRTPGENIELGFALAEFARSFGGEIYRTEKVSLASCWRAHSAGR